MTRKEEVSKTTAMSARPSDEKRLTGRQQAFIDSVSAANSLGRHLQLSRNDRAARDRLERLGLVIFDATAGEYRITEKGRLYVK